MKKSTPILLSLALITGLAIPIQAATIEDVPAPQPKKSVAQKCKDRLVHMKNCLAGKEPCSKTDFAIFGASAVALYSFGWGFRQALFEEIREICRPDKNAYPRLNRFKKFMKYSTEYDPIFMAPALCGSIIPQAIKELYKKYSHD